MTSMAYLQGSQTASIILHILCFVLGVHTSLVCVHSHPVLSGHQNTEKGTQQKRLNEYEPGGKIHLVRQSKILSWPDTIPGAPGKVPPFDWPWWMVHYGDFQNLWFNPKPKSLIILIENIVRETAQIYKEIAIPFTGRIEKYCFYQYKSIQDIPKKNVYHR